LHSIDSYNERDLLLRTAAGDESAFSQLFHQWYQHLAGYLYRITESSELAEEILQDVFLKIWMTRETLAEGRDFKAFLIVVSRNHACSALRKIMRKEKHHKRWERR